jgi:riboflavin biosynthesis pyrimidine reductase
VRRLWPDPTDDIDLDAVVAAEARPPYADRPWVLVNMISSLDGAITVAGRSGGLARPADKALFRALRAVGDVVLVGAGTARDEGYGPARPSPEQRAARRARGQAEVPAVALVSRSLDLDVTAPLFQEAEARTIVITCADAPAAKREALSAVADVIVAGTTAVDLPASLAQLGSRGARVITCEGGPRLNGDLIAADLVDEWALTLSPLLTGGEAQRAAHGIDPPAPRPMRLARAFEGDGLLLLRWLRDPAGA